MPTFRCTTCERRIQSAVVLGAGDCPHCGGDVVFDLHGADRPEQAEQPRRGWRRLLRRWPGH